MQISILPDEATMYQALVNKDRAFEGIFYAAIKTTGIFCRPTCHARKPNSENVLYFGSTNDALHHGFRPCKVCRPMEKKGQTPEWLTPLMREVEAGTRTVVKDQDLRNIGLNPARVAKWFKHHHGMTFQAFLRSLRINNVFGQMSEEDNLTQSAYHNDHVSISELLEKFKHSTEFSLSKSEHKNIIVVTRILTPLGPMIAGATEKGICLLEFADRRMLETQFERLKKYFKAHLMAGRSQWFNLLRKELDLYFDGKLKNFGVPIDILGTDFQMKVWQILQDIPYGKTRSYKEQAIALAHIKAIRAVATANGDNRIAIVIPCHRVIGSDGSMTGYGGGIWRKQWLLALEQRNNDI